MSYKEIKINNQVWEKLCKKAKVNGLSETEYLEIMISSNTTQNTTNTENIPSFPYGEREYFEILFSEPYFQKELASEDIYTEKDGHPII